MARGIYKRTLLLESSKKALINACNNFNNISNDYRNESALILMSNSIELISKATLLKLGENILDLHNQNKSISAEYAVWLLFNKYSIITDLENQAVQQLISLRNEATHTILPSIDIDVLHYLMFSAYKFYKKLIINSFNVHKDIFQMSLLSISTDRNLTYADSIEGLLRKRKGSETQRRLLYLLERGVSYDGSEYISQEQFEKNFKKEKNKRLINRGALGAFLSEAELLKVLLVQAPKNHTINIDISKGKTTQRETLPVFVKKTDINSDYPYILSTLSEKLQTGRNIVLKKINERSIKGNNKYHQAVKAGRSEIHKYSDATYQLLKNEFSLLSSKKKEYGNK